MDALADRDLPYLALEEPEFSRDPPAHFAQARRKHPWLAKCSFGYAITQYAAIRELMNHEDSMRMSHPDVVEMLGAADTPWGRFLANSIQAQNREAHRRLRSVLAMTFSPRQANLHRPLMREVISRLLDEWIPRGAFDFEEFASNFPITVMCRIIGASPQAIPRLKSSLETLGLGGSMDPAHVPAFQKAFAVMDEFVRDLVAERRAKPHEDASDLLDLLLAANERDELTDDEVFNLLVFLFVGGFDTSKNVLSLIMYTLLDRPDDYARCAHDPAFCRKVIEETLRYYPVASLPRVIDEDLEFRGVHFPKETLIFLPWGAAGRDPTAVEDPDIFNPDRPEGSTHIAFGLGPHICLGQFIARAQIAEGLQLVAQRIRNPRLTGEVGWRSYIGVWGIHGLPIAFDPEPAAEQGQPAEPKDGMAAGTTGGR